jgi:hypothetical protein
MVGMQLEFQVVDARRLELSPNKGVHVVTQETTTGKFGRPGEYKVNNIVLGKWVGTRICQDSWGEFQRQSHPGRGTEQRHGLARA